MSKVKKPKEKEVKYLVSCGGGSRAFRLYFIGRRLTEHFAMHTEFHGDETLYVMDHLDSGFHVTAFDTREDALECALDQEATWPTKALNATDKHSVLDALPEYIRQHLSQYHRFAPERLPYEPLGD